MSPLARRLATFADLALREGERLEIVRGAVVEKASPTLEHGRTQSGLAGRLSRGFDRRRPGAPGPGGWWIGTEIDVEYGPHEVYRHDASGWRRERMPELPRERPLRLRPDWACEILSPSNAKRDLVDKLIVLQRAGVPHYWILDPEDRTLIVYRLEPSGYLVALTATGEARVRAEPFAAVELSLPVLCGDQDEE